MYKTIITFATIILTTFAAYGEGQILQWSERPSRNMISEASGIPAVLDQKNERLTIPLGTHQYSTPLIANGVIYTGTNDAHLSKSPHFKSTKGGVIAALDATSGTTIWELPVPKFSGEGHHFNCFKCGICSTPVKEGNKLYVVGSRGDILCLDTNGLSDDNNGPYTKEAEYIKASLRDPSKPLPEQTGDIIWSYNLLDELDIFPHDVVGSTILLHGQCLYICTSNGQRLDHKTVANPQAPSLIVLDKDTGKLLAIDNQQIGTRMLHGQWSSPSYGRVDKELIFWGGGDGYLYAFEAITPQPSVQTLTLAWKVDCNPPSYRMTDGSKNTYSSWKKRIPTGPSEIIATPVFHDNKVYVAIGQSPMHGPGQGNLVCVDARTGAIIWQSQLVDRTTATVAIHNQLLYIADYSGNFHCFDVETGNRIWVDKLETGNRIWVDKLKAGTWISSPMVADNKVYIGDEKNNLYVYKAGRAPEQLSRRKFKSMPMTPAIVQNKLYLPLQKRIIVFTE